MEGQIRDGCGGGAGKGRVVTGGGHWRMMRDCKVSMQYMVCERIADRSGAALGNITQVFKKKEKEKDLTSSAHKVPFMLQESLCNYCLTGPS